MSQARRGARQQIDSSAAAQRLHGSGHGSTNIIFGDGVNGIDKTNQDHTHAWANFHATMS